MATAELRRESLAFWSGKIEHVVGGNPPATSTWRGLQSICDVLQPFMAANMNHAHLPTGGGLDVLDVGPSAERGCLEFRVGERSAWVVRPESLTLEHIPASPIDSFLLLDLARLDPNDADDRQSDNREEFLELKPGKYVEREVWDRGFLRYDEDGREVPLPSGCRLVTRWLKGKILIVAKGSLWNGTPATYDGEHNSMRSADIRATIERWLATRGR